MRSWVPGPGSRRSQGVQLEPQMDPPGPPLEDLPGHPGPGGGQGGPRGGARMDPLGQGGRPGGAPIDHFLSAVMHFSLGRVWGDKFFFFFFWPQKNDFFFFDHLRPDLNFPCFGESAKKSFLRYVYSAVNRGRFSKSHLEIPFFRSYVKKVIFYETPTFSQKKTGFFSKSQAFFAPIPGLSLVRFGTPQGTQGHPWTRQGTPWDCQKQSRSWQKSVWGRVSRSRALFPYFTRIYTCNPPQPVSDRFFAMISLPGTIFSWDFKNLRSRVLYTSIFLKYDRNVPGYAKTWHIGMKRGVNPSFLCTKMHIFVHILHIYTYMCLWIGMIGRSYLPI